MFKRILFVAVAIVMVASLGLASAWALGQTKPAVQAQTPAPSEVKYNPAQTITVVGQGTVSVVPDIARITIGVETTASTVADGSTENEAKMKALLAALKAVGIPEKDIQTTNYSIMVNRGQEPAGEQRYGQDRGNSHHLHGVEQRHRHHPRSDAGQRGD